MFLRRCGDLDQVSKSLATAAEDRPNVAAKRTEWRNEVMPTVGPERLVFTDGAWAKTNTSRTCLAAHFFTLIRIGSLA